MRRGLAILASLLAIGCASARPTAQLDAAGRKLAAFEFAAGAAAEELVIVIEGDGRGHDAAGRPTRDPTPARPVGLAIARAWPGGAAWLGRPCQFTRAVDPLCQPEDWTVDRFSTPALDAADAGVSALKRRAGADRVVLVGWSGGGVIAAALTRRRSDVAGLVTLAAPLDVDAWTADQGLTPLNLAPEVTSLGEQPITGPQVHLFGDRDRVSPSRLSLAAARTMAGAGGVVAVEPVDHACCWAALASAIAARLARVRLERDATGR